MNPKLRKVCHQITDLEYKLTLYQGMDGLFTVEYGKQIISGLTYRKAAEQYGYCIMHTLGCGSIISDSEEEAK